MKSLKPAMILCLGVCAGMLTSCDQRQPLDRSLCRAVQAGDTNVLAKYLDSGGGVNRMVQFQTSARYSASLLHLAVQDGHLNIAAFLLKRGADPNQPDWSGDTPLMWADGKLRNGVSREAQLKMMDLLLKSGADPNLQSSDHNYRYTALHGAAAHGHTEIVRLLLANGADVSLTNMIGQTALHLAKNAEVVKLLLGAGADPSARTANGMTPAETADWLRNFDALSVLTNENVQNPSKHTPTPK